MTPSIDIKKTLLYIFLAFIFSFALRLTWYYTFNTYEPFLHNGTLMLTTNDSYYWAEGARDLLAGFHQDNDLSPLHRSTAIFTAFVAQLMPFFSLESVMLFLPALLSSLIVVPIILIARSLQNLEMGLIAALLASIANSYYNRTMMGYLDTDMLNILLPVLLIWSLVLAIRTNHNRYLIITAIEIIAYRWWYPQSYSLEFAFFALLLFYVLVWDRKNLFNYKLLAIMVVAMMGADIYIRSIASVALFILFLDRRFDRFTPHILGVSVLVFILLGGINPILHQLNNYVFRDSVAKAQDGMGLHFFEVMQTIKEAGKIPFEAFATRISGHTITFIVSLIGYAYLLYRHRIMLLTLPLLGLGFLALSGGLRFTIYAVPVLAIGVAFFITEIARKMPTPRLKFLSATLLALLVLLPNITHIVDYKAPVVFAQSEVSVLDNLKDIADREDYAVAWWDYGYPIRYFSDVKTLIDGGKHSGHHNFGTSFVLTSPQEVAAKMARLDVEFTERGFKLKEQDKNITLHSTMEEMTKFYGLNDTNDFLTSLQTDIELPKKSRDIYLYLPYRMLDIYPTIEAFSALDLMNGKSLKRSLFYAAPTYRQEEHLVRLSSSITFDMKQGVVVMNGKAIKVRNFTRTRYTEDGKLVKEVDTISQDGEVNIIYMASQNRFVLLDNRAYNSLYVKLFILEEYDTNLFESVTLTPSAKVFKLKI